MNMKCFPLIAIIVCLFTSNAQAENAITVAVAANMKYAFDAISVAFTSETGIAVTSIVSSSGKLTAQITHGAPYDLFLSADMKYPAALYNSGLAETEPKVYANGILVLWTKKALDLSNGIAILSNSSVRKVAIANPTLAPYGKESLKVLEAYQLSSAVTPKLVYGESIAQVNQYVDANIVDIGFTAKSVVLSPALIGKGTWIEVPVEYYTPIAQGMVILKYGVQHHLHEVRQFYDFILSEQSRKILMQYGYTLPSTDFDQSN
jgi:molybdate transport system substrate-binding protein